jgi:WD40 repeat protein
MRRLNPAADVRQSAVGPILCPEVCTMRHLAALAALLAVAAVLSAGEPKERATVKAHADTIMDIAFYPDGKTFVTASEDGTVRLWDVGQGNERPAVRETLKRQETSFRALALDPAGSVLAAGDRNGDITVWVKDRKEQFVLSTGRRVNALAISADGKTLVSGHFNGLVKVWDLATRKELAALTSGFSTAVLALSPDGHTLACGTVLADRVRGEVTGLGIWDVANHEKPRTFVPLESRLEALALAPNGRSVTVLTSDGGVSVWDLAGRKQRTLKEPSKDRVRASAFSPNGAWVAVGGWLPSEKEQEDMENIALWSLTTKDAPHRLHRSAGWVSALAFSPDGKLLAAGGADGSLRLWDLPEEMWGQVFGSVPKGLDAKAPARCLAFRPDGAELAAGTDDGSVLVWEKRKVAPRLTLKGHKRAVMAVAYAPDGKTLATASLDHSVRLWDAATGKELAALTGHKGPVLAVAFAPDGKTVASGGSDGTARLWDLSGKERLVLEGPRAAVRCLLFTADGKGLLTGSSDGTVRQWVALPGAEATEVLKGAGGGIIGLAPAGAGRGVYVAAGDGTVTRLDLTSGKATRVLAASLGMAQAFAVAPDEKTVALSSRLDEALRLYDAATGKERALLNWHSDWVSAAAFSPDGKAFATAGHDGTVTVWGLPPGGGK